MPKNKNAMIRFLFLDQMLSDPNRRYTCLDLLIKCNEMLVDAGYPPICKGSARGREDVNALNSTDFSSGKRLIQMDLQALQESPFNMEIDSSERDFGAPVYRYRDQTHTLFSKQLSDDEKRLLKEVLSTLGKFSGIDSFSWLQDLRAKLEDKRSFGGGPLDIGADVQPDDRAIISFEENKYLRNKEYLPELFSYISKKQTIRGRYKRFTEDKVEHFSVYPYQLKQYSNRWYLLCSPVENESGEYDPELVKNLPLDRFVGRVEPDMHHQFVECAVDLEERFSEIIGITYYKDNPVEEIIFAVSSTSAPYVETKPIHESQRICLDMQYHLDGYKTFCIECRYNYELQATLSSFGANIIVLSPASLREKMLRQIQSQQEAYKKTDGLSGSKT